MPELDPVYVMLPAVLALIAPLLAALWIMLGFIMGWNRLEQGEKETAAVAVRAGTLSFLGLAGCGVYSLFAGVPGVLPLFDWLHSGEYQISFTLLLDELSLTVGIFFSLVILLTTRFSVNYLHREAGFQRFFIVLSLFHSGILLVVLAGNALLAFVGWELVGISSYLLIAYAWQRETATENATRAFVTNRVGDVAFLFALFVALAFMGTTEWELLFTRSAGHSGLYAGMLAIGLMIPALIKSAQFPFSAWITRALEGPTPSSAVFYGAVMVHLGVYLLLRIAPLLEQLPPLQWLLLLLGVLTVIYSWLCAQVQTDIKSSLLYGTLIQVGLMVAEVALGWYMLAIWHLCSHAVWRAYQFLHAPSFMQQTSAPARNVPLWLQRRRGLYSAALHRFWLDVLTDWLLVRPTHLLARDARQFDDAIFNRITGKPALSVKPVAADKTGSAGQGNIGTASGLPGRLLQWLAEKFEWFEEKLVLPSSGDGLQGLISWLGRYVELIETYLTQPRYLVVLIAATLVVIL
ncbi:MAG: proton-conducting transporter membrane subunit [Thiolinea sp.]